MGTVFAQVLPEDKADNTRELQRGGQNVAMVGIAIEAADLTLVGGDVLGAARVGANDHRSIWVHSENRMREAIW